jgi:Ca-activated chloride channel family protein
MLARRMSLGVAAACLGLLAQTPNIEQRAKPKPKQESSSNAVPRADLRVDTTLVLIPAEVTDNLNRPVSGLEKENFRLFDDKVEQQIQRVSMEDDPIAMGLIFDTSGSIGNFLQGAREAAQEFFRHAGAEEFFLVQFDSEARLVVPLTKNASEIDYQLAFSQSKGSTALLDGVYMGLHEIRKAHNARKALILVSDGGENNSRYTELEVKNALRETDTLIYSVGAYGTGAGSSVDGPSLMRSLAEQTGGRAFPTHSMMMKDFADKIITDLRNRYVISYSPTNAARDGRLHRVEVKLVAPKGLPQLHVHWRTQYLASTD